MICIYIYIYIYVSVHNYVYSRHWETTGFEKWCRRRSWKPWHLITLRAVVLKPGMRVNDTKEACNQCKSMDENHGCLYAPEL